MMLGADTPFQDPAFCVGAAMFLVMAIGTLAIGFMLAKEMRDDGRQESSQGDADDRVRVREGEAH